MHSYFIYFLIFLYSSPMQYKPTADSPPSTPSSSPTSPLPHIHSPRKKKVSQEHQRSVTNNTIRSGKKPHIKAGQGNPDGGKGSEEHAKESK